MGTFSEYLNSALKKYKGHFPLESMIYLSNGNILASTAGEATNTKLVLLPGDITSSILMMRSFQQTLKIFLIIFIVVKPLIN